MVRYYGGYDENRHRKLVSWTQEHCTSCGRFLKKYGKLYCLGCAYERYLERQRAYRHTHRKEYNEWKREWRRSRKEFGLSLF